MLNMQISQSVSFVTLFIRKYKEFLLKKGNFRKGKWLFNLLYLKGFYW